MQEILDKKVRMIWIQWIKMSDFKSDLYLLQPNTPFLEIGFGLCTADMFWQTLRETTSLLPPTQESTPNVPSPTSTPKSLPKSRSSLPSSTSRWSALLTHHRNNTYQGENSFRMMCHPDSKRWSKTDNLNFRPKCSSVQMGQWSSYLTLSWMNRRNITIIKKNSTTPSNI